VQHCTFFVGLCSVKHHFQRFVSYIVHAVLLVEETRVQ